MKKIYDAVERFCAKHPRFGISDLMRYIVIGNVAVFLLSMFLRDQSALSFLYLNGERLLHGELWRIVTFVLVPGSGSIFWLAVSLYFYYWIGSTLERQWGTAKFNLYYFSGVLLTVIGTVLATLISGYPITVAGASYVNLSMFLAFACLFPDTQVLLFFIIPVKMKWLAYLDGGLFVYDIVGSAVAGDLAGVVLPVVALLNFAIFIWPSIHYAAQRRAYQHRPQTVEFKKAVKQQEKQQGYHHKCAVCGRTDADHPELQFRYCSKCAGYHCFCQDHIFSHVHFTDE